LKLPLPTIIDSPSSDVHPPEIGASRCRRQTQAPRAIGARLADPGERIKDIDGRRQPGFMLPFGSFGPWTVGEDVALETQSSAPITAGRPIIAALSKPGQNPGGARGID
jgi:hypothetical protein